MSRYEMRSLLIGAVCALLFGAAPIAAQGRGQAAAPDAKTKPIPRLADGRPNLSGVWWTGGDINPNAPSLEERLTLPQYQRRAPVLSQYYQPWALEKMKQLGDKDDPALHCIPAAVGMLGQGVIAQLVHTPAMLVNLIETYHGFRMIPINGTHNEDALPSWRGDAIAKWEGDTLVTDVTNFVDTNWLRAEGEISFHSDALHLTERFTMRDRDTLEYQVTVEDPKVLTRPWVMPKQVLQRAPYERIMEADCADTTSASLMEGAAKVNYGR